MIIIVKRFTFQALITTLGETTSKEEDVVVVVVGGFGCRICIFIGTSAKTYISSPGSVDPACRG